MLNKCCINKIHGKTGLGVSGWPYLLVLQLFGMPPLAAAAEPIKTGLVQKDYAIAPGSLSDALPSYAAEAGVMLGFDPLLTRNKKTQGLKGHYSIEQGFSTLLQGSGLEVIEEGAGKYKLQRAIPKNDDAKALPEMGGLGGLLKLKEIEVRARRLQDIGPMPGLALTKEQIAGNIQSISAKEIKEANSISLADLLNSKLQSINVNDYQGNPFQMDVSYRGFTAGPQIGTPQGLSVFFDGVRVNEAFGDVVNWDMIPMNALSSFDVYPGSNPLFGLNTLGGALSMRTKSGFEFPGVSANVLTGSYGRKQFQGSAGWNNGSIAAFGAVNLFLEDGWRDNSPSKVNQAFGKLEWQGERLGITLSSLAVVNKLVGNGTVPQELYRQDASSVFTSPDETKNTLFQTQLAAAFDFTDQISLTGQIYHRSSKRNSTTGDIIDQETFSNADKTYHMWGTRLPGEGDGLQCAYTDSDRDGVPDYFVVSESNYVEFLNKLGNGVTDYSLLEYNATLPSQLLQDLQTNFSKGVWDVFVNPGTNGIDTQGFMKFGEGMFYEDVDGSFKVAFAAPAANATTCRSGPYYWNQGMIAAQPTQDRDGAVNNSTGVVKGTPTAVLTNSLLTSYDADIRDAYFGQTMSLALRYDFDQGPRYQRRAEFALQRQKLRDPVLSHVQATDQDIAGLHKAMQPVESAAEHLSPQEKARRQAIEATLQTWMVAMANRNLDTYFSTYAADFAVSDGLTRQQWERQRRMELSRDGVMQVRMADLSIEPNGERMLALFTQTRQENGHDEAVQKVVDLEQRGGRWLIVREDSIPLNE